MAGMTRPPRRGGRRHAYKHHVPARSPRPWTWDTYGVGSEFVAAMRQIRLAQLRIAEAWARALRETVAQLYPVVTLPAAHRGHPLRLAIVDELHHTPPPTAEEA